MRSYWNPYSSGTQLNLVLEHLFIKSSITQVEAEAVYKIRRLAARISEMKSDGWNIERNIRYDLAGQRYARYSLGKPFRNDHRFRTSL